jgi:membrane-anchored protein YejM (alkaline phosphatase superfamily)
LLNTVRRFVSTLLLLKLLTMLTNKEKIARYTQIYRTNLNNFLLPYDEKLFESFKKSLNPLILLESLKTQRKIVKFTRFEV